MKDNGSGCPREIISTWEIHQFAESLGYAIDAKDPFTNLHSEEVAEIAHAIALSMGIAPLDADLIHVAGHLHDIGKIGIPDSILQKDKKLTDDEWEYIRRHPEIGADILRPVKAFSQNGVVDMILHHHEKFNGTGYPAGLKGDVIPIGARIITLADSLSAILQNRPYRPTRNFDDAVEEIINCSGIQFDPRVVTAFLRVQEKIRSTIRVLGFGRSDVA